MSFRQILVVPLILLGLAAPLAAAGRVELEILGDAGHGSPLGFQQWLQSLGQAGIKNVKLRTARDSDQPGIEVRGSEDSPVYVVTGVIGAGDELVLPGARFRRSEVRQLAAWLDDVAKRGPPDSRDPTVAFGLSAKQFAKVREELAKPVGFSTHGMARSEAVEKIGRQLSVPLQLKDSLTGGDEKIEEELSDVSCGTALACILRPIGLSMAPHEVDDRLECVVAKAKPDQEIWPIGWPVEQPQAKTLPSLYEFRNVNVQNVAVSKVLEAVGKHLKVLVLLDHNAMALHGIDPAKTNVSHPQKKTNYSIALRKILFQARLKFELRIDEAGKPILWVTTLKPV